MRCCIGACLVWKSTPFPPELLLTVENVVCDESFKNKSIFKNLPPDVSIIRNSVTLKSRGIPRNSPNSVIQNSAEFRAIPYTIRNIRNFKKHTEFCISGIPKTPYLQSLFISGFHSSHCTSVTYIRYQRKFANFYIETEKS